MLLSSEESYVQSYHGSGLFFNDHTLTKAQIAKAEDLIEQGGDWDRRNRLKVYKGLYALSIRDFATAAKLFFETVATFTCSEIMEYATFVQYAVLLALIAFSRPELKSKASIVGAVKLAEVNWEHECR